LAAGALLLGGAVWGLWTGTPGTAWSFAAVALLTVLESYRMFERGLLNASRRQLPYAGWALADETLRLGCAIAAIKMFGPEALWVLLGYAGGVLAGIALSWRARVQAGGAAADPEWTRQRSAQVARYAFPLSLLAVVGWLLTFSDRCPRGHGRNGADGRVRRCRGLASQPFADCQHSRRDVPTRLQRCCRAGERRRERRCSSSGCVTVAVCLRALAHGLAR
jgi:hypothetical protein